MHVVQSSKMILLKILYYCLLCSLAMFLFVRLYEARALFFPSKRIAATPKDVGLPFEDIYFATSDGVTLNGWLIKGDSPAPVLLFLHGNAGNISHRLNKIAFFHQLGLNVFIMDYRGFGKSEGRLTEGKLYLDADAAYHYLQKRRDLAADKIILYGESVGNVASMDLASRYPVSALIAEGAFTSAKDMAKVILPIVPTFLLSVKMDSLGKIGTIKVPKLFIHSRYDEIVPFKLARKLFSAAPEPKEFLEIDGDHNEGYSLSYGIYTKGIEVFLRKYQLLP